MKQKIYRTTFCRKQFTWYLGIVPQDWSEFEIQNYHLSKEHTLPTSLLRPLRRQRAAAPGRRFRRAWNPETPNAKKLSNGHRRFFLTKPPGKLLSSVIKSDPLSLVFQSQRCSYANLFTNQIKSLFKTKEDCQWAAGMTISVNSAIVQLFLNWILKKNKQKNKPYHRYQFKCNTCEQNHIPYGPHLSELAVRAKGRWKRRAYPGLSQSSPLQSGDQLPTWEEGWGQWILEHILLHKTNHFAHHLLKK